MRQDRKGQKQMQQPTTSPPDHIKPHHDTTTDQSRHRSHHVRDAFGIGGDLVSQQLIDVLKRARPEIAPSAHAPDILGEGLKITSN